MAVTTGVRGWRNQYSAPAATTRITATAITYVQRAGFGVGSACRGAIASDVSAFSTGGGCAFAGAWTVSLLFGMVGTMICLPRRSFSRSARSSAADW